MKLRARLIFSLSAILFFAYFIYEAREWRLQARLYPWAIGIPMLVLALLHFFLELVGVSDRKASSGDAPVDFRFTQSMDSTVARARTITILSWILGFLVAIWLLGFALAIPALAFGYLKLQSREGWGISIGLTGVVWLLFWGLFERLLRLPFPEGQLFTWLGF